MTTHERPEVHAEEALQREADAARQRLFQTIDRIEGRAKTFARAAIETTRVSGWGLLGATALWAGVVLVTRRRQQPSTTRLMLRHEPRRSLPVRLAILTTRGCAAILGFVLTRHWAMGVLAQHRRDVTQRAPDSPQVRQLGMPSVPALSTPGATVWQPRGTPNA